MLPTIMTNSETFFEDIINVLNTFKPIPMIGADHNLSLADPIFNWVS